MSRPRSRRRTRASGAARGRVLFATPEVAPLIKTGGLADVSHSLPEALTRIGVDVHVLLPAYPQVLATVGRTSHLASVDDIAPFPSASLLKAELPGGVPLLLVSCPALFERDGGPYQDAEGKDWIDNAERFGLLSRVAARLGSSASPLRWRPDAVHCNDWQTGLAPAYLRLLESDPAPAVMTIHNLAFQGIFPPTLLSSLALPPASFSIDGVEYYGNLSFLKAGLFYADHLATVSPSYAAEIQTPSLGFGMQGLLATRAQELTGILNGIDEAVWSPNRDENIAATYDARSLTRKPENKHALQARMQLEQRTDVPLLALVSRFTHQKGVDLLLAIADEVLALPAQLALLGSGDAALEAACADLAARYPGQVGFQRGFDEPLSHLIEAGADLFLMPSRFEPCGLSQMYSQRYGTPPVCSATGGLIDTVVDVTEATLADGSGSGFMFAPVEAAPFLAAIRRGVEAWRDKRLWRAIQRNGMRKDFSWETSAEKYVEVYRRLIAAREA